MSFVVDPIRKYEIKGQVCPLLSDYGQATVGTNRTLIAGVTGQRIRVMGGIFQSIAGTISTVALLDGSGGAALTSLTAPADTVDRIFLPITDSGYWETSTGNGLFANIGTTDCHITIFYITYTP